MPQMQSARRALRKAATYAGITILVAWLFYMFFIAESAKEACEGDGGVWIEEYADPTDGDSGYCEDMIR